MPTVNIRDYEDDNEDELDEIQESNWNERFRKRDVRFKRFVKESGNKSNESAKWHKPHRAIKEVVE